MELRLGLLQPQPTGAIPYLHFKFPKARYYIPFGPWCGWTVAKRIRLVDDSARLGTCSYNHRAKWRIIDKWSTKLGCGESDDNGEASALRHLELEEECFAELESASDL